MTRLEFMKELENLLYDIPSDEREEAIQYYNGYFEDAGENHEDEIIQELGSPERVASIIKTDLNSNEIDRENRGYFTENGYHDNTIYKEKFEIVDPLKQKIENNNRNANNDGQYSSNDTDTTKNNYHGNRNSYSNGNSSNNTNHHNNGYNYGNNTNSNGNSGTYSQQNNTQNIKKDNTNLALIILLCIFTLPITLPILGTLFGLVMAAFGVLLGLGVAGVALMVTGVFLFILGFIKIGIPFLGLAISGGGLIVLGLGMLFVYICYLLCKFVLPSMIRGIVALCRMPFKNRSVTV